VEQNRKKRYGWPAASTGAVLLGAFAFTLAIGSDFKQTGTADCSFQANPEQFLRPEQGVYREIFRRAQLLSAGRKEGLRHAVAAASLPVRNLVDAEIFGRLAREGIPAAPLSGDEEFVRRIHLDLTGRLPSPEAVQNFLRDDSPDKRTRLIEELFTTPEYVDKWTMWMGEWLKNTAASTNVNRQPNGRNALYRYLYAAVERDQPLRDVAYEALTARGNNFDDASAPVNFIVASITPMGPIQDQYDTAFANAASTFLGLGYYDCLLCHNGRGHLEEVSLWGKSVTRLEAMQTAAFFSRQRIAARSQREGLCEATQSCQGMFYFNSFDVDDRVTGAYGLNTNFGNRPNRTPIGNARELTPEYRGTGMTPRTPYWREEFAELMIRDPMFARNLANRLWKAVFNLGLVEPVDALDPARLDPAAPPAGQWDLQATHPELLEKLAQYLRDVNFQMKPFLRLLLESSAYQLSSRYDAAWSPALTPLFARHLARRLEGEEIHDAIVQATGAPASYTVTGFPNPVQWAMQLPEPNEPRGNPGNAVTFMNTFFRGNRDNTARRQDGSIQQQLALMNDLFVLNRLRVAASPVLRRIAGIASPEEAVRQLYLVFLSRSPSRAELASGAAHLAKATSAAQRNAAVEDLAWVCVNKVEFLFSY
jgi:hypothetical protein